MVLHHNLFSRRYLDKRVIRLRFLVLGLLIYFIWIVNFALSNNLGGTPWSGIFWSSGGPGALFPIPQPAGMLTVITPAYPIDAFIYSVFIWNG